MLNSIEVTELLQRGIAAAKNEQTQDARQILLKVTELDEENEQAWLWLSGVVESFEDRRICLENVLTINPHNGPAQSGLHWLNQRLPPPPDTQERCLRCQAVVPLSGMICPECGQLLIVACPACGEYVDVQDTSCYKCGQAIGNLADGARYHVALAQEYIKHNRGSLAQEAAARATAEAPNDSQILKDVATLHQEMGNSDMAIAVYKRAIENDPENAVLYAHLGAMYHRREMRADARAMYERATEIAADTPAVLFEMARLHVEQDHVTQETLRLLKQTIRLDPKHVQAHLLLGDLYFEHKQGSRALDHYERACELTTPDSLIGRQARRKRDKWRSPLPDGQVQGWGETLRRVCGMMLIPALAALTNAGMIPWKISLVAWGALAMAGAGAYLCVCATDVPRNPLIRLVFGPSGLKGLARQALVGIPGVLLWAVAFGLILRKV